ncbi:MAG TPA: hypothetical protein DCS93_06075 [Microscillaceae bacterium]|nr:hypothetical protein [Microscillaceae bacterium]
MDPIIILFIVALLFLLIGIWIWLKHYKTAPFGFALVRFGQGGLRVSFTKMMVFPMVHKLEYLDLRLKHFSMKHMGESGAFCRNNLRVNLLFNVFIRVNPQAESVAKVAQSIGCKRAGDPELLQSLFLARFQEAIKTVTKGFDYEDIVKHRSEYCHQILQVIGVDLNGFVLNNIVLTHLSLVDMHSLDPDNILDAEAIHLQVKKCAAVLQENNQQEAGLQREFKEIQLQLNEQKLMLKNQIDEEEALHEANIRFLEEEAGLDERMTYLKVKQKGEISSDIKKRLEKQVDEIAQKKLALKTQLELEEKSIKVRYQRKILAARQSDELPPEATT